MHALTLSGHTEKRRTGGNTKAGQTLFFSQDHGAGHQQRQVLSAPAALLLSACSPAARAVAVHGHLPRGDEVHRRWAEASPRAPRPPRVRPREPRLRPPRRRALHRRLQRPRPPLARRPARVDRVRPQLQAPDGGDVRGEEEAGGAGERVRAAAGPAVPPRVGRPLLRGRVPGADARGAPRRPGGGGGHGGRRQAVQLRQRRGRRPGDRPGLLHGQQRHVPAERVHHDHPDRRSDRTAAAVRPGHEQHHRTVLRPILPQRRGAERGRHARRGGRDHGVPAAPPLAARPRRRHHRALRGPAGVPGQRAPRQGRRRRRVPLLGGAEPGQVVADERDDAPVRGCRQGPREDWRRHRGAARAWERHDQRSGGAAWRRALVWLRRHALCRSVEGRRPLAV